MSENTNEMDVSTYLTQISDLLPNDIERWELVEYEDTSGEHVDVVLCSESEMRELLNGERDELDMTCVAWIVGHDEYDVLEGYGDENHYDVSSHVETFDSLDKAVEKAARLLH